MEDCPRQPLSEDHVTTTVLLIEHVATSIVLFLWIRTSYKTVELAHPMFGLLFQEMIVLALFNVLNIIALCAIAIAEDLKTNVLAGIYIFTDVAALQFHQVTCLSVTCLRYYLLYVAKPQQEIDLSRVYKISFIGVWLAEAVFLPLGQIVWIFSISQEGWPEKRISEIAEDNEGFLVMLMFKIVVFSNLPDYISIILYFKMYLLSKSAIHPEVVDQNQEAYGGIWVGDSLPPIEHEQVVVAQVSNSQAEGKMKSISKFMRMNVIFCLADMTTVVVWNKLLCQGPMATAASYTFQNFVCYWIPIVVLGINFKKLRGCCKCNSN